jgi:hypothetical protein
MFRDVAIVPEEDTFWLTFMAANVETTSANAATVKTIASNFGDLVIAIGYFPIILKIIY